MSTTNKRNSADYGDFTQYQVRKLEADYVREFTLGLVGWGVDFITWLDLKHDIQHQGMFKLSKPSEAEPRAYAEIDPSMIVAMRYNGSNGGRIIELANGLAWFRGSELLLKSTVGSCAVIMEKGDWFVKWKDGKSICLTDKQFKEKYKSL